MSELLTTKRVKAASPSSMVQVGEDGQSHIVDQFFDPWCGEDIEMFDHAEDVDCPACVASFQEEGFDAD